ncbi:glycine--tRNA ligase subunit beta [Sphingomonas sp. G124]|uniref:Glycine--tRNA ligase beta subunit n=1 Tax=Sphingomonas cremea TaxID=2904799 RepID=A0A9X1QI43_9SPHN|nr:glycine--tRNA ligase subunit beta [Sphingomonas cremea]MCF2513840.1 glycine--tRNA ligase subunit beta [Sphingomonas cremea]
MSADFLLELLSEEIPARMQARARNDLARMFAEKLTEAGLGHDGIVTYSTPRRLALIARGLPPTTEAVSEEVKGPRTSAPAKALEGFLRKTGLTQDQLQDRDGTWFAVIDRPGRSTADVLADAIAAIVRDFPWPKSMRWGAKSISTSSLRWVRPLHSIVALLGDDIVPVAIDGIECGATTRGHRFHHPGPITIGSANDYVEKLRACHVIVDQEEREAAIRKGAIDAAEDAGLLLVEDEGLVVENAGLTSWPVPLFGSFDHHFLDVPEEVIQLTARTNQKYFVMRDGAGKLAPHFVCVANIAANDGGEAIVAGNERVLAARLSDARFFWEQDLKVPLEEQAKKLEQIVFHDKLGTVADKVERVAKLARWLVEQQIVTPAKAGAQQSKEELGSRLRGNDEEIAELADQAERAARLAKADLVAGMVGEFPELQGVIGGYLARAQGEPDAVADAIRDHYKPVGQGDEVPTAPVTVAVSLADKFDTLVGFFMIDQRPTGSRDPFALRRAALGVLDTVVTNGIRLPVTDTISATTGELTKKLTWNGMGEELLDQFKVGINLAFGALPDFFTDRLKVQQRETGVRHDIIDAAVSADFVDDYVRLLGLVKALQGFVEKPEGANLLAGYKRAANILKKEKWPVDAASTSAPEADEQALVDALDNAQPHAAEAVEQEDFTGAMEALSTLRGPIDAFFDKVTVNDPDSAVRARRLNLLARFRDAVHTVADFSKIEG